VRATVELLLTPDERQRYVEQPTSSRP
jgi:hypothetical protein